MDNSAIEGTIAGSLPAISPSRSLCWLLLTAQAVGKAYARSGGLPTTIHARTGQSHQRTGCSLLRPPPPAYDNIDLEERGAGWLLLLQDVLHPVLLKTNTPCGLHLRNGMRLQVFRRLCSHTERYFRELLLPLR